MEYGTNCNENVHSKSKTIKRLKLNCYTICRQLKIFLHFQSLTSHFGTKKVDKYS